MPPVTALQVGLRPSAGRRRADRSRRHDRRAARRHRAGHRDAGRTRSRRARPLQLQRANTARRAATSRWCSRAASAARMPPACCAPPRREHACRRPRQPRKAQPAAASTRSRSPASSGCWPRRRATTCGKLFSAQELLDAGDGPGRAASLAARFAAKEACVKLFPREAALGAVGPADFSVSRDGYGAPAVELSESRADRARTQPARVRSACR